MEAWPPLLWEAVAGGESHGQHPRRLGPALNQDSALGAGKEGRGWGGLRDLSESQVPSHRGLPGGGDHAEVAECADAQERSRSWGLWQAVSLGPARTGPRPVSQRGALYLRAVRAFESHGAMEPQEERQATGKSFPRQRSLPKWGSVWPWRAGGTGSS